jgi:hypothetical protein
MNPITIEPWLLVLQGLLTPVIGVTTAYIAYQQWRGARYRLRMDQYERRLRIYQSVVAFVRLVVHDFNPGLPQLMQFPADTAEADFLFDEDIPAYIDQLYKRAWDLHAAHKEYRDFTQPVRPNEPDQNKVLEMMHSAEKWFVEQLPVAKEKFKQYLHISR